MACLVLYAVAVGGYIRVYTPTARVCPMPLVMVVEAWILSVIGWAWFALQEPWFPSPLSAFVFYGFLVLTTSHLLLASLFAEERGPRVAYFNMVVAITIFCGGCIADTFQTSSFGVAPDQPLADNVTRVCCVNCDMPRYHRALFFSGSSIFMVSGGILIGYLLVHLLLAGGQMLAASPRTVWGGGGWSLALAFLLACRFIVLFDMSTSFVMDQLAGVRTVVIPDMVFYLLIFSQPLLSLATLYWLVMIIFLVLMMCEGIPTMGLLGIRIIRSVEFGLVLGFAVFSSVELWEGGMLTLPLLISLLIMLAGSAVAMLEAYLGVTPVNAERLGMLGDHASFTKRPVSATPPFTAQRPGAVWESGAQRMQRDYIPIPIQGQMSRGKKGV